jgi:hypothetical protein
MSVLRVVEPVEPPSSDAVVTRLDELLAELAAVVADGSPVPDADRIDRLDRLERARAAIAAVQTAEMVRFGQSQVAEQLAMDVHPKRIGQGIADQIALACRVSPWEGSRRLGVARALWFDLPQTYTQLTQGRISERVAEHVVAETRHLDAEQRRAVDAAVSSAGIEKMGVRAAAQCARKHAYEVDPKGYVDRGKTERKHRRVSLRSAPDTMSLLTGYLPVEQGVACWASLRKQADTLTAAGDRRSRGQIMADLLVERLTGQASAEDVNVEVQLMMPLDSLLDPTVEHAAHLLGIGPLPGPLAREVLLHSKGRKWWRRLFTQPAAGSGMALIGGDPHRRTFNGWLAQLIRLRDQTCRDPHCALRGATPRTPRRVWHRSGTPTMWCRSGPAAQPPWPTGAEYAPAATTSAKCPAGRWIWSAMGCSDNPTPSRSPPPPGTATPARRRSRPEAADSGPVLHSTGDPDCACLHLGYRPAVGEGLGCGLCLRQPGQGRAHRNGGCLRDG